MCGALLTLTQYVFMAWCLVKHKDNFIFTMFNEVCVYFQMRVADSCSVMAAESVQVNIKHACLWVACVCV